MINAPKSLSRSSTHIMYLFVRGTIIITIIVICKKRCMFTGIFFLWWTLMSCNWLGWLGMRHLHLQTGTVVFRSSRREWGMLEESFFSRRFFFGCDSLTECVMLAADAITCHRLETLRRAWLWYVATKKGKTFSASLWLAGSLVAWLFCPLWLKWCFGVQCPQRSMDHLAAYHNKIFEK